MLMRWMTALAACAVSAAAQVELTPADVLQALTRGNARFVAGQAAPRPVGAGGRRTLSAGQHPAAIVLTCADSRVAPEHVFHAGLGELFVVRTAGNTCDAETLASIEYAAEHLGAKLLVVLGHEHCGAVQAAVDGARATPAITRLIERIAPAVRRARREGLEGADLLARAIDENVHDAAADAVRRSPPLRALLRQGRLQLAPAHYSLQTGLVTWLPLRPLEPEPRAQPAAHPAPAIPPQVGLQLLQAGHRRFVSGHGGRADLSPRHRAELARGQQPFAVVLTCADSRVAPEHLFDCGLGEIFVVRVAGNVLSDATLASVEYAAGHLGAGLVLVMGHSQCGAVQAAIGRAQDPHLSESMQRLLERIEPAVERARRASPPAELGARSSIENTLRTVSELRARSTLLRDLEHDGRVGIVPVVYDLVSGDLDWLAGAEAPPHAAATAPAPHAETATAHAHPRAPEQPRTPAAASPPGSGAAAGGTLRWIDLLALAVLAATAAGISVVVWQRRRTDPSAPGTPPET